MATLREILARNEPIQFNQGTFGFTDNNECADELKALLGDLQGNILTWHNRTRAHYFFVNFKSAGADAWITKYLLSVLANGVEIANAHQFQKKLHLELMGLKGEDSDKSKELLTRLKNGPQDNDEPLVLPKDLYDKVKGLKMTTEFDLRKKVEENKANDVGYTGKDFFISIMLTPKGYTALGAPKQPDSKAFQAGMVAKPGLNARARGEWKLRNPPTHPEDPNADTLQADVDALIIFAYNEAEDSAKAEQKATLNAFRDILNLYADLKHEEVGIALPDAKAGAGNTRPWFHEPFGFRDGISQPVFYKTDLEDAQKLSSGDKNQKFSIHNPGAPLDLVLVPDPNGGAFSCGTYFVYRKLKQDVEGFYGVVNDLMVKTRANKQEEILALMMGRSPDGKPLVVDPVGSKHPGFNDFNYADDTLAQKCPFHAHIRKVAPRNDGKWEESEKFSRRRIARRGMSYGPIIKRNASNLPEFEAGKLIFTEGNPSDLGTHFMCAQSDLESQFEHMQGEWANKDTNTSGSKTSGADPIGGLKEDGNFTGLVFPMKIGSSELTKICDFKAFVEFMGGEYFFAPSISFFKHLSL